MKLIAIDPGANGAIALFIDGFVSVEKMPEGMTGQVDLIETCVKLGVEKALMEKTGKYIPGNSVSAAMTFGRHCGHLESALYSFKIPTEQVAPGIWMRGLKIKAGDRKTRKKEIKELMQRTYPKIKVTLVNADALGILTWYMKKRS